MKFEQLLNIIKECLNDVIFTYNGKKSGISSEVENYKASYIIWYGEEFFEDTNLFNITHIKLFDGKALCDICEDVEFEFV